MGGGREVGGRLKVRGRGGGGVWEVREVGGGVGREGGRAGGGGGKGRALGMRNCPRDQNESCQTAKFHSE